MEHIYSSNKIDQYIFNLKSQQWNLLKTLLYILFNEQTKLNFVFCQNILQNEKFPYDQIIFTQDLCGNFFKILDSCGRIKNSKMIKWKSMCGY